MTAPPLGEVARFGVVGLAAYGTDLAVFNGLLLGAGVASVPAKVVAGLAAIAVAYAGSRWWTWRDRRGPDVGREYAWFLLFSVLAAGLQVACLVVSRDVLELRSPLADNVSANLVGMALATAFRFWTFRTFVFPGASRPGARRPGARRPGARRPGAGRPGAGHRAPGRGRRPDRDVTGGAGGTGAPARGALRS